MEKIYIPTHIKYQVYRKNENGEWKKFGFEKNQDKLSALKKVLKKRKDKFRIIKVTYEEIEF